jgi:acyl dehydratase
MIARQYRTADLPGLIGRELGRSSWHAVTQREIDLFAEATGDRSPLHVDPEAARRGPFGRTVAHGFLILSLVAALSEEAFEIVDAESLINYGVNRVRFPAPLPEGGRVMLSTTLNVFESRPAGHLLTLGFGIDLEGSSRQVAVGETILLAVPRAESK